MGDHAQSGNLDRDSLILERHDPGSARPVKLGILADIHEHVEYLRRSLAIFSEQGVDQVVVLGDVFELGQRLRETVALLDESGTIGVWGNHEFGLCTDPSRRCG